MLKDGDFMNQDISGMRCLVTGAGGFLGSHLVASLISKGAVVTGFGRTPFGPHFEDGIKPKWILGSFDNEKEVTRACEGQDCIFHLLNSSTPASATLNPASDITSNVVPSIHLLEACKLAKVKKFIFASSGGTVYGAATQIPTTETAKAHPISAYGVSKLTIENYLAFFGHIHELDYRILRITNPYGPGQSPFKQQGVVATFIHAALQNQPINIWGDGSAVRDYIYISDVIDAFTEILTHTGEDRIFNIGSGTGKSISEVWQDIKKMINPKSKIIYHASRKLDVPVSIVDTTLMQNKTTWRPKINWNNGLKMTRDWMIDQHSPISSIKVQ
ncbi:NAD-dependent epimerase/dehydratase family protein [Pigmentiphaga aceris]|nr:NAD-dependent epimerase/dehydratase family protein [Pigmentiphaga aceris]